MKFLFLSDVSASKVIGGAERVLSEQTSRLSKLGHHIRIITRLYPYHDKQIEMIGAVEEWRIPVSQRSPALTLLFSIISSRRYFQEMMRQRNVDCIVAHQPFTAVGLIGLAKKLQIPLIYVCHSLSFEEYLSRHPIGNPLSRVTRWINVQIRRQLEKRMINNADRIIVLSDFTRKRIDTAYGTRSRRYVIIPGGVDIKKFAPAQDTKDVRRKLGLPEKRKILLTIRNLVPRMGLENLILAIGRIAERFPDALLIIGGEGALENSLRKLAKQNGINPNIKFVGFVPEKLLPLYYQAADVFVLPTKELEGFGLITIEALSSGLPVFGTPIGGTLEILSRFDDTFLFENTSPEAISTSIITHFENINGNNRKSMEIAARCRHFVEQNFSWDLHIETLEYLSLKVAGLET